MPKFKKFLEEKVTQKEIATTLSNRDIRIGIEFEMILDDIESSSGQYDGYTAEELDNMWNAYHRDINDWLNDLSATQEEWEYEMVSTKKDVLTSMKKELSKIKDEDDKENIQDEINTLENENTPWGIFYLLGDMGHDPQEQYDYINENLYPFPSPTSTIKEFYEIYYGISGWDEIEVWSIISGEKEYSGASELLSHELNNGYMISDPSDILSEEDNESAYVESLENYFDNTSDLPFSDYKVGGYHDFSTNSSFWRIETDESLSSGGVEIISPAIPLPDMIKILPKMFKWIKKHGTTDKSTGMHVNLSYKGKNLKTDADMLKLMLMIDEGSVWKKFPERVGNQYTAPILAQVIHNLSKNQESVGGELTKSKSKLVSVMKKGINTPVDKYFGVNASSDNRIEFRYLGGSDYHRKEKEVIGHIGKFAYYMTIAFDPKAKRKEYITKLSRLYNKYVHKNDVSKFSGQQIMDIAQKGKLMKSYDDDGGDVTMMIYKYKGNVYYIKSEFLTTSRSVDVVKVLSKRKKK